ncbi:phosphonate ABC transporter ATP-binding protein [Rhodopseudomonas sp. B29]|uniref:phosphonate ABC transporter ATP-binding protein n=1 Tax=Rhodopseudomonas sp. B29 TaxID=95607 RepID=UPI0003467796|nr:phosphonate ABC transporter ATP-binding protein [Rhodopseudomonas sp. B29]
MRGLKKSYGEHRVLNGIDLDLRRGEFVVVLGPSGTGKSTLFRCITRLTEPDEGAITFDGLDVTALKTDGLVAMRRRCGFVFQQFNLVRRLSAIDNVLAGRLGHVSLWRAMLGAFSRQDRQLALASLDAVGMLDHAYKRVDGLSGGQQQRVAIARTLAQQSQLVIADEPIASLDPESARTVLGILRKVAKEKQISVLCSLHQVEQALAVGDRIVGFRNGRIVVDCPAQRFTDDDSARIYGPQTEAAEQPGERPAYAA